MFSYLATGLDTADLKRPRVDYNHVLGFGSQNERIDPHSYIQRPLQQPSLIEVVRTIREGVSTEKRSELKSKE